MKELIIVLLVLATGFGSSAPVTTNFSNAFYPSIFKGGILANHMFKPAKVAVFVVEGNYEYYLQYLKFKLDYKMVEKEQEQKKKMFLLPAPGCQGYNEREVRVP